MLITKGGKYKPGICRVRGILGDLRFDFDEGKEVDVSNEQYELLKKYDWCELIPQKIKAKDIKPKEVENGQ